MVSCVQFVPAAGFLARIEACCCGCGVVGAVAALVGVAAPGVAEAPAFCCA